MTQMTVVISIISWDSNISSKCTLITSRVYLELLRVILVILLLTFQRVRERIGNFWSCWIRSQDPAGAGKPSRRGSIRSCRRRRDLTRFTSPSVPITPASLYARGTFINGAACWWSAATGSSSKWWTDSSRGLIGKRLYASCRSEWYRAVPATG